MRVTPGAVLAGLMVLAVAALASGPHLYLEFRSYPDEMLLRRIPVRQGDHFSTVITHSIHLSPVYETYRVADENKLVLESTRLKDMGWGVPSTFDNAYTLRDGFMVIQGYEKILPELPFRVSAVNQAKLLLGELPEDPAAFAGETVRLDDYAADGKRITFRIVRVNGIAHVFYTLLP